MRRMKGAAIAVSVGLLVAACGGSSHGNSNSTASGGSNPSTPTANNSSPSSNGGSGATASYKKGGSVTISNEAGQNWTCQFNPFNPAVNALSIGFVYEPLVYVNSLKSGAETPMLASSYTWSSDKKSITFTIRDGVKWNDGQPMTAADVAFTFNLMKANAALDLYSLWTGAGLQSVAANGNQVTMTNPTGQSYTATFNGPDAPMKGDPGINAVSVKRMGNTLQEVDKHDGKIIGIMRVTVSADGKTAKASYTDTRQNRTTHFDAVKQ